MPGPTAAAAHLVHEGDLVILISYAQLDDGAARTFRPHIVHVDALNAIVALGSDASAPVPSADDLERSPNAV